MRNIEGPSFRKVEDHWLKQKSLQNYKTLAVSFRWAGLYQTEEWEESERSREK